VLKTLIVITDPQMCSYETYHIQCTVSINSKLFSSEDDHGDDHFFIVRHI